MLCKFQYDRMKNITKIMCLKNDYTFFLRLVYIAAPNLCSTLYALYWRPPISSLFSEYPAFIMNLLSMKLLNFIFPPFSRSQRPISRPRVQPIISSTRTHAQQRIRKWRRSRDSSQGSMETVNELNIIQDHINKYFVFATPAPPPVHIFLNPAFIVVCLFSSIISFSRLFLDPSDQDLDREHNQLFLQLERMRNSESEEGKDHASHSRTPWNLLMNLILFKNDHIHCIYFIF